MNMEQHPDVAGALNRFSKFYSVSDAQFFNGTPCWIWHGAIKSKSGYGSFGWTRRSQSIHAHRAAFRLMSGDIPGGMQIDHLCRVRNCVNPSHLEVVTPGENIRRGLAPALARDRQLAKTHCPSGHPYDSENTYNWPGHISRACIQCKRERERAKCTGRTPILNCKNGHPFTPESTYLDKHGWRSCLICRKEAMQKHYQKSKKLLEGIPY